MSKIEKYTDLLNKEVFVNVGLNNVEDPSIIDVLSKAMVAMFVKVYGQDSVDFMDCEEDEGCAYVPALIETSTKKQYVALIAVSLEDSGEHYDTVFFTSKGAVYQNQLKEKGIEGVLPYKYRPLVEIVGDIHTHSYF